MTWLPKVKGQKEGTDGRRTHFNLIIRNAEKRRWYDKRDRVKAEIKDELSKDGNARWNRE